MIAVQILGWCGLAFGMILVELVLGRRHPPHASELARLTDQLMATSTGVALVGGVLGAMVFPGIGLNTWLSTPAGLAIGAGGLILRATAMLTLGRHYTLTPVVGEGHRLITTGPYRFIRHPGYSGIIMQLLGLALLAGSAVSVAFVVPVIVLLPLRIRVEERLLTEHFGDTYAEYARRTRHRLVVGVI
jgi:protein-S-isoprenylcysteine O-methyltransferase Ste14